MFIREKRFELKMTQMQLALKIGTTQFRISAIERGVTIPNSKEVKTIAKALEIKLKDLELVPPLFPTVQARVRR